MPHRSQDRRYARNQSRINAFSPLKRGLELDRYLPMLTPAFLHRQADNCVRIARTCFDLASAERLRLMAAELRAKATELEQNNHDFVPQGMVDSSASSRNERG